MNTIIEYIYNANQGISHIDIFLKILFSLSIFLFIFVLKKGFQIIFIIVALLSLLFLYKDTAKFIAEPLLKNFKVLAYNESEKKKLKESAFLTNKNINCIKNSQAIVVMGAGGLYESGVPNVMGQERIMTLVKLLKISHIEKEKNIIIFTGGAINSLFNKSVALGMKQFFIDIYGKKVKNFNLILEEKSYNTLQSANNVRNILLKMGLSQKIILVTSSFHMYRSKKVFEKLGFNICPIAAPSLIPSHSIVIDFKNTEYLLYIIREYFHILIYYLAGLIGLNDNSSSLSTSNA